MIRTFFSLNIDINTKRKIKIVRDQIFEKFKSLEPECLKILKWEDENNYHITLFFIGDIDKVKLEEIESAFSEIGSDNIPLQIKLKTGKINAFPNLSYPRVLILDVIDQSSSLDILSKEINKCLLKFGFKSDKPFHPHITLARVRRNKKINLTLINDFSFPEIEFNVRNFSLMESRLSSSGAEHFLIRDFNFLTAGNKSK